MARALCTPLILLATLALALNMSLTDSSRPWEQKLVGGLEDANVNSKEVQEALDFAVKMYNQANDDMYLSRVVQVLRAQKQVVAGMNYYLMVELGRTKCTKSQTDLANCPLNEEPDKQKREICSFQIYTVPWQQKMSMTEYSCHSV